MSVYCTLVVNDRYLAGAIAVARQLRQLDPEHDIVCLATLALSVGVKAELSHHFKTVHVVDTIDAGLSPELALLNRPELRLATTKLHLWALPYDHVVYLDADTLPVRGPFDLLFQPLKEGEVAAAPDTGWPDLFNSGVLGLRPSEATFDRLLAALSRRDSLDGSDQGILNASLDWVRVPFVYNVTVSNSYQYRPAYLRFADDVRILHFTGATKPWDFSPSAGLEMSPEVQQWWQVFREAASSPLTKEPTILAHRLAYEAQVPQFDPGKIIAAPPDYWDAATHAPLKGSKPEAEMLDWPAVQALRVSDDGGNDGDGSGDDEQAYGHVFPEFGPPVVRLPFEEEQAAPERIF